MAGGPALPAIAPPAPAPVPGAPRFTLLLWMVANIVADIIALAVHNYVGVPMAKLIFSEVAVGMSVYSDWRLIDERRNQVHPNRRRGEVVLLLLMVAGVLGLLLMAAMLMPPSILNPADGQAMINNGLWLLLIVDVVSTLRILFR